MSEDDESWTPDDEAAFDRLFVSHPPLALLQGWEADLRAVMAERHGYGSAGGAHENRGADSGGLIEGNPEGKAEPIDDEAGGADVISLADRIRRPHVGRRLVVEAAVLLALVGGAAVVVNQFGGGAKIDSADDPGRPSTTSTVESEPATSESSTSTSELAATAISDSTGTVTIEVPAEWAVEVDRGPSPDGLKYLAAAPRLEGGFYGSSDQPGVSITVYNKVEDPEALLEIERQKEQERENSQSPASCTGSTEPVSAFQEPYPGRIESMFDCGASGLGVRTTLVMVDAYSGVTVVIVIQLATADDFERVVYPIRSSLTIQTAPITLPSD